MRRCPCCFHSTYGSHPVLDDKRNPADTLDIDKKTMVDVKRHFATVIDPYKKTCPRCRYKLEHQDIAMCDHCTANQMLQRALEYFAPCTKAVKKTESDYLAIRIDPRLERDNIIRQHEKEEQSRRRFEPANFSKPSVISKVDEQLTPQMKEVPISDDFYLLSTHKSLQFEKAQFRRLDAIEEGIKDKRKREKSKKSILGTTLRPSVKEHEIRTSRKENVETSKERKERKRSVSRSMKDRLFSKDGERSTSRSKKRDSSKTRRLSEERKKTASRNKKTESSRDIRSSKEQKSSASRSSGNTFASNKRKSSVSRKEKAESFKTRPSSKDRKNSPARKEKYASIIPTLSLSNQQKGLSNEEKAKSEKVKRQEIREKLRSEKEQKISAAKKQNHVSKDRLSSEERMKSTLKGEEIGSSKDGPTSTESKIEASRRNKNKYITDTKDRVM